MSIEIENIEKHLLSLGLSGGYLLKDKGRGNFIARWDHVGVPIPTAADLSIYNIDVRKDREIIKLKMDLKEVDLSDDMENLMDAMLVFDQAMFDAIGEETLDKYRMKKTLKNK